MEGHIVIKLLLESYEIFNRALFNQPLPAVEFRVNLQRKQVFYFIAPNIIELGEGSARVSRDNLLEELLHVMVHVSNHSKGVVDVTRNQYHKMDFCKEAIRIGLFVQRHTTRGWGITSVNCKNLRGNIRSPDSQELLQKAISSIPWNDAAQKQYQQQQKRAISSKPQKQFQFKYICECDPPFIVRVGRRPDGDHPFMAKCLRCNANFAFEES